MTTIHEPAVDALDVDAPAAAQLDIDAQRAGLDAHMHVTHPHGGPTRIHFDSREDFLAVVAYGLIHADPNPAHTKIDFEAGLVRVPATHGWPYLWNAEATYPTQPEPEPTCQDGCEFPDPQACAEYYAGTGVGCDRPNRVDTDAAAEIPVVVLEMTRRMATSYVHYGTTDVPYACDAVQGAYSPYSDAVTCPDCAVVLAPPLPRRIPGAALVDNPAPVEPMTRFLRDAYSPERAAEARDLASVLIEEKAE